MYSPPEPMIPRGLLLDFIYSFVHIIPSIPPGQVSIPPSPLLSSFVAYYSLPPSLPPSLIPND